MWGIQYSVQQRCSPQHVAQDADCLTFGTKILVRPHAACVADVCDSARIRARACRNLMAAESQKKTILEAHVRFDDLLRIDLEINLNLLHG